MKNATIESRRTEPSTPMTTNQMTKSSLARRSLLFLLLLILTQPLHAYYCPTTGRFLNRDPIGERGGANVYAFARNSPVFHIDILGMGPVIGGGKIVVDYDPPDPRTIMPTIDGDTDPDRESGTSYGDQIVKCTCGKLETVKRRTRRNGKVRETKRCCITCRVSFSASIFLSSRQAAQLEKSLLGIYGHEQKHVLDRNQLVDRNVVAKLRETNGCYSKKEQCDKAAKKLSEDYAKELIRFTSPDPNFVRHDNVDTTPMPEEGKPYPPLKGTYPAIIDEIRNHK